MDDCIVVKDLVKQYGEVTALNGVSFRVRKGDTFAFLGVNGAGKSTTINILCGALTATWGSAEICGFDIKKNPQEVKKRIGIVFQDSVLDGTLSVKENLFSRAALYGYDRSEIIRRVDRVTKAFRLEDLMKRQYGKLSGGQRRRVDIARALLNDPEILFLDEPTTGLDPATRELVWELVDEQRERGLTVFLTTHYMEESVRAEKIVIIDEGKILVEGTPDELKSKYAEDVLRLVSPESAETERALTTSGLYYRYRNGGYDVPLENLRDGVSFLQKNRGFEDFEIKKGTMDDVFLKVTGKSIRGGEDA